jgi:hypothetical protein
MKYIVTLNIASSVELEAEFSISPEMSSLMYFYYIVMNKPRKHKTAMVLKCG